MRKGRYLAATAILTVALAACETAPASLSDRPAPTGDGLYYVDNSAVGLATARPDVNWSSYNKILISDLIIPADVLDATPESLSRRNSANLGESWVIPPEDGQKLANEFKEQITREFENGGEFQIVQNPGPGTLVLRTQLTDIELVAPVDDSRQPGSRVYSDEAGSLTIAGDLVDGQTGQTLAQFADNRMSSNDMWEINNSVTNFADAKRIFRQWGVLLRGALIKAQAGQLDATASG